MTMKIVADSCCDLNDELKQEMNIEIVPLTIQLGGKTYYDDANLNIDQFIKEMKNSEEVLKTACPSPQEYMDKYVGEESVFVVTLSSSLSGSYNSAVMAKEMFLEDIGKKFIHVFDSLSASVGETLVCLKIHELIKKQHTEWEIVEKVNSYIKEMKTFFLLESLDTLTKAGRISPLIAKAASLLSIRPIMAAEEDGSIRIHEKIIGAKRAFKRFVEIIGEQGTHLEEKVLGIAHCNCLDKALAFREEVLKKYRFKDIVIVRTAGISSVYANEGGIIVVF